MSCAWGVTGAEDYALLFWSAAVFQKLLEKIFGQGFDAIGQAELGVERSAFVFLAKLIAPHFFRCARRLALRCV